MSSRTKLRFGLYALRGAGKTTYLSAICKERAGDGVSVTIDDPKTIEYFRPYLEMLAQGKYPPATAPNLPDGLEFCVRIDASCYELSAIDYAGELADPRCHAEMEEFQSHVHKWFADCDFILVFVDPMRTDPGYNDAVDKLITVLLASPTPHGSGQRAVALVVTKCDTLTGDQDELADPDRAAALLGRTRLKALTRLTDELNTTGERAVVKLFLTSSVGWTFGPPPPGRTTDIEPCNLFAPLKWGVEQAAQIVAETHDEILAELEDEFERIDARSGFDPFNAGKKRRRMKAVCDQYLIEEGPRLAQFQQRLSQIRSHERRAWLVAAVVMLLTLIAAGWSRRDGWAENYRQHYADYQALVNSKPGDANVHERVEFYETNIASLNFNWLLGTEAMRTAAEVQAAADKIVFDRINQELRRLKQVAEDYRRLQTLVVNWNSGDGSGANAIETLGQTYLTPGPDSPRANESDVRALLQKVAELKRKSEFTVTLTSVSFRTDCDLYASMFGYSNLSVTVDGKMSQTKKNDAGPVNNLYSLSYDEDMKVKSVWGKQGEWPIKVTTHRSVLPDNVAKAVLSDSGCILAKVNAPISIKCKKGKTVTIVLKCPEAALPALPDLPAK